jgi:hypothetical protein
MAIPVNIFNANNQQITINVNNATSGFTVAAAAPTAWTPQTPQTNPVFNQGPPSVGALGIGMNSVQITPSTWPTPFNAQVSLPGSVNWTSCQIYIFFLSASSCSWIVLNNGQVVSQSTVASEAVMAEMSGGESSGGESSGGGK